MLGLTVENSTFPSTERWKYDQNYWTSFEVYPESTGKSFYTFKGKAYHQNDYWSGTMVAVKTFRHIHGTTNDWSTYKRRCDEVRKMAANFNKYLASITSSTQVVMVFESAKRTHYWPLLASVQASVVMQRLTQFWQGNSLSFVKPVDAIMENISDVMKIIRFFMRFDKKFTENEVVLFEDFLEGDFKTFVTNRGFTTGYGSDILAAFCHFTYHFSNGNLVVCNLKGIETEGEYKLTNPTIHSDDGCYGDKDTRFVGICDFFNNHMCNSMCENYIKPSTKDMEGSIPATGGSQTILPMYKPVDPQGPPPYDTGSTEK